jgi:Glycosyltransferase 61
MIVKNISAIQYFLERFDTMDIPHQYTVDYHPQAPKKTFTTNPTFLAEFHDCLAHSLPLIITNENHLITSHIWPLLHNTKYKPQKTHNLWEKWVENIEINLPPVDKQFNEPYKYVWLPIDEHSANNAWHIWIDVISKFRLIEKHFSHKYTDFIYVLSNPSEYFDRVAKELFPDLKYYVMPKNTTWKFAHLLAPSMSNHSDGITVPDMVQWLRHKFAPRIENCNGKIFLSRTKALSRRLTNSEEIFMAIKGWENIELENLSIIKQMNIFANAKEIITTHGAGLINLLWCNKGTKIIEITQKEQIEKKVYPILSSHLELNHKVLIGETVPIHQNKTVKPAGIKRLNDMNDIKIDIKTLLTALDDLYI